MTNQNDLMMLADIARMYYEDGATQADIAKVFNISRSLVSKHLKRAREEGIVEISIRDEFVYPHRRLIKKLKNKYGLEDVIIITSQPNKHVQRRQVGKASGRYFTRRLGNDSIVGVSAGRTLYEMANTISRKSSNQNTTFVSLTGGLGTQHRGIQSNEISTIFSERLAGEKVELDAPVVTDTAEAKNMLMQQTFVQNVLNQAKQADIALVGIGGTLSYNDIAEKYLHQIDPDLNTKHPEIVADICYNFIDQNGELVDCEWNNRVISLDLPSLQQIPLIIGVAEGLEKVDAIHATIQGNLIDVLVTDSDTAEELLKK